mgnify:CR=1 FL=1
MTFKEKYDKLGYPYNDIELTISAMGLNGVPRCIDDNNNVVYGVWPTKQDLRIEIGARYKARQYIMTGSMIILTEKL